MSINDIMTTILTTTTTSCIPLAQAVGFCAATSVAFVGSLYILVPARVRAMDRNRALQIKWRSLATAVVCIGAYVGRQYLLYGGACPTATTKQIQQQQPLSFFALSFIAKTAVPSARVLAHVVTLYAGPIAQGCLFVAVYFRRQCTTTPWDFVKSLYDFHWKPTLHALAFVGNHNNRNSNQQGWVTWRNLVLAPLLEEVAFRTCMVPVLLAAGLGTATVCWTAPLFFGVAHVHHAIQRIQSEGTRPAVVVIQTLFQLTYTTLFGAYASYAYIKTNGSTTAVFLAHAYCNWMGLPDLAFLQNSNILHENRWELMLAHIIGAVGFAMGFQRDCLC